MANMFSSRKGPLLLAAGVFGGLLYYTAGAKQQPRPRATPESSATGSASPQVSETLQSVAGTGGQTAREQTDIQGPWDTKDQTRLGTGSPDAYSKRNPQKVRGDLGGRETTVGGGGQGKHVGERESGKGGDLDWKTIGSGEGKS